MKRKFVWLIVSGLLVAALLLASCGPAAVVEEEEEEEEEVVVEEEEEEEVVTGPQYGGWLSTMWGHEPTSFDPQDTDSASSTRYGSFYLDRLMIADWTLDNKYHGFASMEGPSIFMSNLAKSWERIDPLTIRFTLEEGVRWNAGKDHMRTLTGEREFTADDVVWHFGTYLPSLPRQAKQFAVLYTDSVTAVDKYTVDFKATEPLVLYINYMNM